VFGATAAARCRCGALSEKRKRRILITQCTPTIRVGIWPACSAYYSFFMPRQRNKLFCHSDETFPTPPVHWTKGSIRIYTSRQQTLLFAGRPAVVYIIILIMCVYYTPLQTRAIVHTVVRNVYKNVSSSSSRII